MFKSVEELIQDYLDEAYDRKKEEEDLNDCD